MDSLTTHYLARALDARWRGRRVTAVRIDRDAPAVIVAADGSSPVRFPVAPGGAAALEEDTPPTDGAGLAGWTIRGVSAGEDDRRIVIAFERSGKFRGSPPRAASLEIGLMPTARGARLRGDVAEQRIGARLAAPGAPRPVMADDALVRALRDGDRDALLGGRWMSPAVIAWLAQDPAQAAARYHALLALPAEAPAPVAPLFAAGDETPAAETPRLDDRRARAIARMERELRAAAIAPRLRAAADALRALGDAAAPHTIQLADGPVPITPRPGERAGDAADRLHGEARSMERALEALPARIAAMRAAPAAPPRAAPAAPSRARPQPAARPYREYRSSGGLDIWAGRGAASNDHLTFHASSPDDVWLHARDAAGAHVVLRWTRDDPPPALDLAEAAAIAAWHSKGRGSRLVPVDWTRRKHVRKPRGGPPGLVLVERTKTVNARPSAELERKLRKA